MTTEARRVIHLAVPLPPQSWHPNSRAHWHRKWSDAGAYAWEVLAASRPSPGSRSCSCRLERARLDLVYVFPTNRRRDGDNLIAWSKPLIDNLTRMYLVDDDLDHLEIGRVSAEVQRGASPHVRVTLTGIRERQAKQTTPPRGGTV